MLLPIYKAVCNMYTLTTGTHSRLPRPYLLLSFACTIGLNGRVAPSCRGGGRLSTFSRQHRHHDGTGWEQSSSCFQRDGWHLHAGRLVGGLRGFALLCSASGLPHGGGSGCGCLTTFLGGRSRSRGFAVALYAHTRVQLAAVSMSALPLQDWHRDQFTQLCNKYGIDYSYCHGRSCMIAEPHCHIEEPYHVAHTNVRMRICTHAHMHICTHAHMHRSFDTCRGLGALH